MNLCFEPKILETNHRLHPSSVIYQWENSHWGSGLKLTKEGLAEYIADFMGQWTAPRQKHLRDEVSAVIGHIHIFEGVCKELDGMVVGELDGLCSSLGYSIEKSWWETTLVEKRLSVESHVDNFVYVVKGDLTDRWKKAAGRMGDAVIAAWGHPFPSKFGEYDKNNREEVW